MVLINCTHHLVGHLLVHKFYEIGVSEIFVAVKTFEMLYLTQAIKGPTVPLILE